MEVEELAKDLIDVFRAGRINTEQEAALVRIEILLGVKDTSCHHDMDSTCDADNVFHCNGCGAEVPQPAATVNVIKPNVDGKVYGIGKV